MQLCALRDAWNSSATMKSSFHARNKQAPLVDMRGVHGEFHDDGTYSSGLGELRTIKEPKLQARLMTFPSSFSEIDYGS